MVTDHKHTHQTWLLQTCAAGWLRASFQGLLESELLTGACWCLRASAPLHQPRISPTASRKALPIQPGWLHRLQTG